MRIAATHVTSRLDYTWLCPVRPIWTKIVWVLKMQRQCIACWAAVSPTASGVCTARIPAAAEECKRNAQDNPDEEAADQSFVYRPAGEQMVKYASGQAALHNSAVCRVRFRCGGEEGRGGIVTPGWYEMLDAVSQQNIV